jgi:hypothetical protein
MTKIAFKLVSLVILYGHVNFEGGNNSIDWDEYMAKDEDLYEEILTVIKELDERKNNSK